MRNSEFKVVINDKSKLTPEALCFGLFGMTTSEFAEKIAMGSVRIPQKNSNERCTE